MREGVDEASSAWVMGQKVFVVILGIALTVISLLWISALISLSVGVLKWAYAIAVGAPCLH